MWKNYLKISIRNLIRNKVSSFINIGGLTVGMAAAILIGLWMYDELNFNKYHENYADLAQIYQNQDFNGETDTDQAIPVALEKKLRASYSHHFKYISLAFWPGERIFTYKDQVIAANGNAMQKDFPEMLSLKMLQGSRFGLQDPNSILLSKSLAQALFSREKALNKLIKIGSKTSLKVAGVYEDLPKNSEFANLEFIMPWDYLVKTQPWIKEYENNWDSNSFQLYVQLKPGADIQAINQEIIDLKSKNISGEDLSKSEYFLTL